MANMDEARRRMETCKVLPKAPLLALSKSIWSRQFVDPGLFSVPKLTHVFLHTQQVNFKIVSEPFLSMARPPSCWFGGRVSAVLLIFSP